MRKSLAGPEPGEKLEPNGMGIWSDQEEKIQNGYEYQ